LTNQAGQATQSVGSLLGLISSTLTFLVLLASAFALNVYAAVVVLALAVVMFAVMRPLRKAGIGRARQLSRAQLQYARGIAESIRIAEEAQVFGAGAAQRRKIDRRVEIARRLLFQTQLLTRIGGSIASTCCSWAGSS
jgi:ABC-type multidrug transport system fused ATPase/permease subunit